MTQVSGEGYYGTAVHIGEPFASAAEAVIICENTKQHLVLIFIKCIYVCMYVSMLYAILLSGAHNIFGLGIRGRRTLQAFKAIEENV